jgi:CRISPR-associated endonuclease/helicase Cas3
MDAMSELLAKSPKANRPDKGLAEHCEEVMDAFECLFGKSSHPTPLGNAWLRFFKVPPADFSHFYANGIAACGLHDLGKANNGFQSAVRGKQGAQVMRHEHLSALILFLPQFRDWLATCPLIDVDVVLSAVAGHHLKASPTREAYYPALGEKLGDVADLLKVLKDDADFHAVLNQVARRLEMQDCKAELPALWSYSPNIGQDISAQSEALIDNFRLKRTALKESVEQLNLLLAVKAAVIAADAAGSGLVREGHKIKEWLDEAFDDSRSLDGARIESDIIKPRLEEIAQKTGKLFEWNDFQHGAAKLPDRALLLAACGSGKTLAAWRWIQSCLVQHSRQRVIFLYPTRATATEGFRDYVSHAPEADAALLHGTSAYELQDMFSNPTDGRSSRSYDTEDRLYALAYWQRRVFSATVDQFLGFMQQVYRSVCLLPVLADSVVVFDEIHSFDKALFSTLKRFFERFDVPVLCMTASLPKRRRDELVKLGFKVFPDAADRFADLERLTALPRYKVEQLDSQQAALQIAKAALFQNKRCLWVVNTVDRCQQLARELNALCYHSRFTLDDRTARHGEVVRTFQAVTGAPVIAVTTQVCEMSLDLDAQVLISEVAPITAMIQRMGRCNRHAKDDISPVGQVYFYTPDKPMPYSAEDLGGAADFVAAVQGKTISQALLEELLENHGPSEPEPDRIAAFIDDGFWSRGGREDLRDGLDFSVPAILDADIEEYLRASKDKKPTDGFVVPVPKKLARDDPRLGWLKAAPNTNYDSRYGFFKDALTKSQQEEPRA